MSPRTTCDLAPSILTLSLLRNTFLIRDRHDLLLSRWHSTPLRANFNDSIAWIHRIDLFERRVMRLRKKNLFTSSAIYKKIE